MRHGTYRKKLRQTFVLIGACFVLCFGILMSWLMISVQQANYRFAIQHTMAAKSDTVRVTLNTILNALYSVQKSPAANYWASSKTDAEYYYYATNLLQFLSKAITNVSLINYDIFITKPDDTSFVISLAQTQSKSDFFTSSNSGVSSEQYQKIKQHFNANPEPYVMPIYADNKLSALYYIVNNQQENSSLLYFVRIPINTLVGAEKKQEFIILNNNSPIAYSTIVGKAYNKLQQSDQFLATQKYSVLNTYEHFTHKGNDLFLIFASPMPWTIAFLYDSSFVFASHTILYIFIPLIIFSICCFVALKIIADKLYRPIKDVISVASPHSHAKDGELDEFQIISKNISTVFFLNRELQNAINENNALATRRYFRELLYGIPDLDCPLSAEQMSASYCVAVIELETNETEGDTSDWYLHLQKNYLYAYVQEQLAQYGAYCISEGYATSAIILRVETRKQAEEILMQLFTVENLTAKLKIALSNVFSQVIHICDAYSQALRILEYRYTFADLRIITETHLQSISGESYYYPLIIENRLIQAIANGKPISINIYDNILEENFANQKLSSDVTRNLIYALIGTIMRVFQELKTTPDLLLGSSIDFQGLYESWRSPTITEVLSSHIKNIVVSIQRRHDNQDDVLLTRMLDYIRVNYHDDIMLVDISEHCNISPTYCSTLFKRLSRDNFKTYLNKYRIERACEIIQNDPSIKISQLSTAVGFNSSNSFIRVFGKITGTTPKAYAEKRTNDK